MEPENRTEDSPPEPAALQILREKFAGSVLETGCPQGDATAVVRAEDIPQIMEFLRDDPRLQFDVLADLTAVDFPSRETRFEVVYHLLSVSNGVRLRIKLRVGGTAPALGTVSHIWPIANWLEREVWDMFGIRFEGHPDLRRILLYEEFKGHPLRKDYPIRKRQPRIGPMN